MIAVKKEDQAKLAVLGIALVAVLGFGGFRMYSMFGSNGGSSAAVQSPAAPVTQVAAAVAPPVPGINLPYAELPAPNEPNPFRQIIDDHRNGSPNPMPLPMAKGGLSPMLVNGLDVKPVELPPLRLDGVIAGRVSAAIVTMGERTDVLSIGGSMGDYTLVKVDPKTATFECKRGPVCLLVGEQTKPPTPPPAKIPALPVMG